MAFLRLVLVLSTLLPHTVGQDVCIPDIPGCSCYADDIQCIGLTTLPVVSPTYRNFHLESCTLGALHQIPMQYNMANSFILKKCQITYIADGLFTVITSLKSLNLAGNSLTNFTANTLHGLSHLKVLDLSNNRLTYLNGSILDSTPSLVQLHLAGNPGLTFHQNFLHGVTSLKLLNMSNIGLTAIPTYLFRETTNLVTLDLSGNLFNVVGDNMFADLHHLQHLNLSNCNITELSSDTFHNLDHLDNLWLCSNKLSVFSPAMAAPFHESLRHLTLDNNQLAGLANDALPWGQLQGLYLSDNPWTCDCALRWLAAHDLNVTCFLPPHARGYSVRNVTSPLACTHVTRTTVALTVVIVVLIVSLCAGAYYTYRILQNQREQELLRRSYTYSAVYKDTVEFSPAKPDPPPRPPAPPHKQPLRQNT